MSILPKTLWSESTICGWQDALINRPGWQSENRSCTLACRQVSYQAETHMRRLVAIFDVRTKPLMSLSRQSVPEEECSIILCPVYQWKSKLERRDAVWYCVCVCDHPITPLLFEHGEEKRVDVTFERTPIYARHPCDSRVCPQMPLRPLHHSETYWGSTECSLLWFGEEWDGEHYEWNLIQFST